MEKVESKIQKCGVHFLHFEKFWTTHSPFQCGVTAHGIHKHNYKFEYNLFISSSRLLNKI
jgi:hypothetical protein